MKIAQISTFRTECGVGKYCEELSGELAKLVDLKVFAEILTPPQTETEVLGISKDVNYERCWKRYQGYETLSQKILEYKPDYAHFQFVSGVYNELAYQPNSPFQQFVSQLHKHGIKTVFTFHDIPEYFDNAPQLKEWYKNLDSTFVIMNPAQHEGLHKWYPEADIHEIPLGTPVIPNLPRPVSGSYLVTQIGFYGTDKGMLGIIKAIPNIEIPNLKVTFAGGFHPLASPQHRPYVMECIKEAVKLKITNKINFTNKLLSEAEIDQIAVSSNILILNQQMVFGYSTSASAHRILTAKRPIVMSKSPKLSEFEDGKICLKCNENELSETINKLYNDSSLRDKLAQNAYDYGLATTFDKIAKRHVDEVYK
jgi:glycosyltransferase involved in cell wall biosynthesis